MNLFLVRYQTISGQEKERSQTPERLTPDSRKKANVDDDHRSIWLTRRVYMVMKI
jgi:hypothetical protein